MISKATQEDGHQQLFHLYTLSEIDCKDSLCLELRHQLETSLGDNFALVCKPMLHHLAEAIEDGVFSVPALVRKTAGIKKLIVGNISHPTLVRSLLEND